ncbi:TnsD family Tn7-like transposition protein [Clostridium sp. 'White wine YQ']|uniref:TnsD family Tn7-like transposition protein n=1 Tax=Clostridium sp. 'White wine YQ' TaxID=3027474 RepID=UPI00236567ED|nr:TnsD family Tn7-like transposition protein [Clostridium sp. 'White wine YQ']MDD7795899.1 TnsD family Tn7-like transposition protein [Clostridium sp. 'White wine YQ']
MIYDFPALYKDELLYSILGRYHLTDGNRNTKILFKQLFGKSTVTPVIDIPCNIEKFSNCIPENLGYSSNEIIKNYTLFPLYSPFMDIGKRQECIDIIKFKDGKGIKHKIGIIAGSICKKKNIYYCPECVKFEITNYGETFIHRLHQVQGVHICEKHCCKLKEYKNVLKSKASFNYIDIRKIDDSPEYISDRKVYLKLLKISQEVKYLLENDLSLHLDQNTIRQRYYNILFEKGYITANNNVKQSKLMDDFINYYGDDFLVNVGSPISISNESNWLKVMLRKPKQKIHPIRHILFIDFLVGSIEQFIMYTNKKNVYLCLNRWCNHYKDNNMTKFKITADYKTRELVATVKCENCGFIYSRKVNKDMNKVGRIKNFGPVWCNKLAEVLRSNMSLRAMSREMGCDCKTIVKYAEKLRYSNLTCSDMNIGNEKNDNTNEMNFGERNNYRNSIIKFMEKNPCMTISSIRLNRYKEFAWLYKNDRDWLHDNLPEPRRNRHKEYNKVDWEKRDNILLMLLKNDYNSIKRSQETVRITKTLLGRRVGKLSYIEKKLDKLPLCKEYLESVQETVEEYQIRRVYSVCSDLINRNESIVGWKVRKLAGLKNNISEIVKQKIERAIANYVDIS